VSDINGVEQVVTVSLMSVSNGLGGQVGLFLTIMLKTVKSGKPSSVINVVNTVNVVKGLWAS